MKSRMFSLITTLFLSASAYAGPADWRPFTAIEEDSLTTGMADTRLALNEPRGSQKTTRRLIYIDPGHPNSFSNGTTAPGGSPTETHINWLVANKLAKILRKKGLDVRMTKSSEGQPVENKDRALIANRAGAAMSVRLHCDAGKDTGYVIYYPDRKGVYECKGDVDNGFTGPSESVIKTSRQLAEAINRGMSVVLAGKLKDGGIRGDSKTSVGEKQGALTGSIFSEIPVVTVEMVVLTNLSDARFIKDENNQELMAQAIAAGILQY